MLQPHSLGCQRLTATFGLSRNCLYSAVTKISPGSLLRLTISMRTAAVGNSDLALSVGSALPAMDLENVGVGLWPSVPSFNTELKIWTWQFQYQSE